MSIQNKLDKLITRFEIGFDNETKADIDALKAKIDKLTRALSVKNDSHGDRLLAVMQAEAANDAPQPELKQLGQWVFEGQSAAKWLSASVDAYGDAFLSTCLSGGLEINKAQDCLIPKCSWSGHERKYIGHGFDATDWSNSTINRQPVNDVDYLSSDLDECVPHIDDVLDRSESIPQITQADMQLIFIKNLSETLIQRMHSMDRFSDDDYAIGGNKLMAWDILIYEPLNSYAVLVDNRQKPKIADLLVFWDTGAAADASWNTDSDAFAILRTITEAELPAFRAALEACYA